MAIGEMGPAMFLTQQFAIRAYQGRMAEMAWMIEEFVRRFPRHPMGYANLAMVRSETGSWDEVRDLLATLAALETGPVQALFVPSVAAAVAVPCERLGEADMAVGYYESLLPRRGSFLLTQPATAFLGPADGYLAVLAQAAGRWSAATEHYEDAIAACARIGNVPVEARTQYEYARGLLRFGSPRARRQARELLDRALEIAADLDLGGLRTTIEAARARPA